MSIQTNQKQINYSFPVSGLLIAGFYIYSYKSLTDRLEMLMAIFYRIVETRLILSAIVIFSLLFTCWQITLLNINKWLFMCRFLTLSYENFWEEKQWNKRGLRSILMLCHKVPRINFWFNESCRLSTWGDKGNQVKNCIV